MVFNRYFEKKRNAKDASIQVFKKQRIESSSLSDSRPLEMNNNMLTIADTLDI